MTETESLIPWSTPRRTFSKRWAHRPKGSLRKSGAPLGRRGPNRLREIERCSIWPILWDQVKSLIVLLLMAAMLVSFATGQTVEGIAVAAAIEETLNPDGNDPFDSNPYNVVSLDGNAALVVDAGGNALHRTGRSRLDSERHGSRSMPEFGRATLRTLGRDGTLWATEKALIPGEADVIQIP